MNVYKVCTDSMVVVESSLEQRKRVMLESSLAILLCAVAIGILGVGLSLIQAGRTIANVGSVKGVGVGIYWDSACTNGTSSINWGILDPGSNKTATIYVRNEGNAVVTLSKTTQNWIPTNASNYMSLNWNYANQTLSVNQVLQVSLALVVSPTVTGITSFSFDITITAAG
jgi:hypothetical protein